MLRKLLFWSVAFMFPLPLVLTYDALAREPEQLRFYITLGFTAYAWWLLAILLSVRPPWLERLVGLPSIYGLHGMLGIFAIVLAYVHRDNSYSGSRLAILLGDWSFYAAVGVFCFSVFFLSGWLVDRVRLLLTAKRLLERVFRHQLSVWVHRLNLVIVAMIWLHAHLLVRVNQYFAFMMLLDLYTVAVLSIYAWKKWIAPDTYLTATVVSNEARGASTRRLSMDLDHPSVGIRPGDFFFLRFEGTPAVRREWHPFSVTDDDQKTLSFTIRQHGDFTGSLTGVAPGTRVRLEGPFGRFESIVRKQDANAPLVFLGMGAGVAPLLSLAAAHHTTREIHVLWAVRDQQDAYYRDVLARYQESSGGRMRVTTQVGRFRRGDLTDLLPAAAVSNGAFFIVGPNPAVLANQRLLRRIGVSSRRIHQERLTM
ncbi:putative ferric reductase [Actinoplanes lutulentus]|uniref:Putative ferric reductase n=1 Tax=Actinoplanes lutulentus TaxID=1287878 RepID=A0A327Z1V7_9ACTN|nr:FAD-binding oxidoreductase [Actinoplanes lutulentus]MBB2946321.1 putative ferric reductase [Actinoplanes lutulentus]RAK28740.1 putative ferric reductase [Actinoplanes lutulentus]